MIGFGSLGVLPMIQLFLLWKFCDNEIVGRTLLATTVASFLSAFCDGTSSYRGPTGRGQGALRTYLIEVMRVRLSRMVLAVPIAIIGILLFGKSTMEALAAPILACANALSFAFVERNFGVVTVALRREYISRLTCLLLPAVGAATLDSTTGLVVGCIAALIVQAILLGLHARPRLRELQPSLRAAFSRDLLSGFLSLGYASFSQLATAALLAPVDFARFITIDRIVRSGLLVTEPARLLYLRRSWSISGRLSSLHILVSAIVVSIAATAAVALLFLLGIPRLFLGVEQGPSIYITVCFLTSMVSFTTLCGFVRFDSLRTVNALLGIGLVAGGLGFVSALRRDPFTAALTFETMVCAVVVIGAIATDFGRRAKPGTSMR